MIVFINGKQKRVRREPTVEGLPVDEFIRRNADPIWLHQAGDWEELTSQALQLRSSGHYALHPVEAALQYLRAEAEIPGDKGHGGYGGPSH